MATFASWGACAHLLWAMTSILTVGSFATTIGGCASTVAVRQAVIDRGYPSKSQLGAVLAMPSQPREEALQKGITVEQWELAGPFPDRVGSIPYGGDDSLARALVERLTEQKSDVVLTESMQCYAREIGRFVARHGGLPEEDLQAFAAGRCGVVPVTPSFLFSLPSDPLSDEAALEFFENVSAKANADRLARQPIEIP